MTYLAQNWRPDVYELDTFVHDSYNWRVAGDEPWSFKYDPATTNYRFELRKGDRFESSYWSDSVGVERTEMGEKQNHSLSSMDNHFHATYQMMIEPGPMNTAQWLVTGQLFTGGTPPFEVKFMGNDRMAIVIKYGTSSSPVEKTVYLDSANVQRGHWYDMELDVKFDASGTNGHAYVWRDGLKIADYEGKIGYTNATEAHWEMGAYRKSPSGGESFAVNYKNVDLTYGAAGHTDGPTSQGPTDPPPPDPDPIPNPEPPPPLGTVSYGTSGANNWIGTSANDTYFGRGGNDTINGKGGNDVLWGESGADNFVFDSARGSANLDRIKDFTPGVDKLHIENAVYSGGDVNWGRLPSHKFTVGAHAADSSDRFIYNKDTGMLYFDKDGSGYREQVEVVQLKPGLHLTASDFYIL